MVRFLPEISSDAPLPQAIVNVHVELVEEVVADLIGGLEVLSRPAALSLLQSSIDLLDTAVVWKGLWRLHVGRPSPTHAPSFIGESVARSGLAPSILLDRLERNPVRPPFLGLIMNVDAVCDQLALDVVGGAVVLLKLGLKTSCEEGVDPFLREVGAVGAGVCRGAIVMPKGAEVLRRADPPLPLWTAVTTVHAASRRGAAGPPRALPVVHSNIEVREEAVANLVGRVEVPASLVLGPLGEEALHLARIDVRTVPGGVASVGVSPPAPSSAPAVAASPVVALPPPATASPVVLSALGLTGTGRPPRLLLGVYFGEPVVVEAIVVPVVAGNRQGRPGGTKAVEAMEGGRGYGPRRRQQEGSGSGREKGQQSGDVGDPHSCP